ncbi:MAG TPA: carotenoid biosynthesis protein [Candidatus Lokiarchaeia archaeon]|nr:carotenoid biosynthesis protein [Candidatus Lokiarchaeia archaeon]
MMLSMPVNDAMFQGLFYEISALIASVVGLIHCYSKRGKWDTIKIYVIGLVYGMILENGGPAQIPALGLTGYFWESHYNMYLFEFFGYGVRLSQVPLATQLGWPMMFYLAVTFWEQICKAFPGIKRHVIISGLIISSSGLMFDLPFDILASRFHWWVWNADLLPVWFGVPLINYLAWFWAVVMFGWFWVYFHNKQGWNDKKITKMLLLSVPIIILADVVCFNLSKIALAAMGLIYT